MHRFRSVPNRRKERLLLLLLAKTSCGLISYILWLAPHLILPGKRLRVHSIVFDVRLRESVEVLQPQLEFLPRSDSYIVDYFLIDSLLLETLFRVVC